MNGDDRDDLQRFLRSVRRRLWLEQGLPLARGGLWLAALCTLLGGAVHLAVRGHSAVPIGMLAAVLTLASLALSLVRARPTPEQAARAADRWFSARGWMLAAHDQLGRPEAARAGGAGFVLDGARERAAGFAARLRSARPLHLATLLAPALLLLLAGAIYLLPGRTPEASARRAAAAPPEPHTTAEGVLTAAAGKPRVADDPAAEGIARPIPVEAAGEAGAAALERLDQAATARGAADGDATGSEPGHARPLQREPTRHATLPAVRFVEIAEVDAPGGQAGRAELREDGSSARGDGGGAMQPVAADGDLAREALRPELRAWIAARLERADGRAGLDRAGEPE